MDLVRAAGASGLLLGAAVMLASGSLMVRFVARVASQHCSIRCSSEAVEFVGPTLFVAACLCVVAFLAAVVDVVRASTRARGIVILLACPAVVWVMVLVWIFM